MNRLAIWAVTPNAAHLAVKIAEHLPDAELYFSASLKNSGISDKTVWTFERLSDAVSEKFALYKGHIFIMSAGIVVRVIAPHIRHKTIDPAVVVLDEKGYHAISLLSGHIGGANELAAEVGQITGAEPVITTATDINQVPAIDLLAKKANLFIENPEAVKTVTMAVLKREEILLYDPCSYLSCGNAHFRRTADFYEMTHGSIPGIFIADTQADLPLNVLILRPRSLVAGIGCNRNTDKEEMKALLYETLGKSGLSPNSLRSIASIDIKKDEAGLIALAEELELPLRFFSREELSRVETIETPSETVEKHIGVKSVCEAAAILASETGTLIVPKHRTRNVTVAIAGIASIL